MNPHVLADTRPSTWRVYQFRHSDVAAGWAGRVDDDSAVTLFSCQLIRRLKGSGGEPGGFGVEGAGDAELEIPDPVAGN